MFESRRSADSIKNAVRRALSRCCSGWKRSAFDPREKLDLRTRPKSRLLTAHQGIRRDRSFTLRKITVLRRNDNPSPEQKEDAGDSRDPVQCTYEVA